MQGDRHLRSIILALASFGVVSLSGCFLPSVNPSSYFLAAPLVPIGAAAGSGRVEFLIDARRHAAYFELVGLAPDADYTVMMDGVVFTTLSTDAAGYVQANLSVLSASGDPRGRRIAVLDPDGVEVLELAGPDHPAYGESEVALLSSFAAGGGAVQTTTVAGVRSMSVGLHGVDPGVYDVVADGVVRASLDAQSGQGTAVISPLDFDPATVAIELQLDGVGYFAGAGHASIEGLDWCNTGSGQQALETFISGIGNATLATRVDCGRRFEVTIRSVLMAEYDLFVGGILRGALVVGEDENGDTIGTAFFSTSEGSMGPLDFDPVGQTIEVTLGGVQYFALDAFFP